MAVCYALLAPLLSLVHRAELRDRMVEVPVETVSQFL
jgi:hypothetical protein